ncbi:hypothetical protein BJ165DRAFT_1337984 [Panaeolus papilionaceus]|nr:hypothetical protein BJ165DRAFT_1337984 [Panaeolus papilionaceus]
MLSSTRRQDAQKQSQEALKRQIAQLQEQLLPETEDDAPKASTSKSKPAGPAILAPPTPSPRKKRKVDPKDQRTRGPSIRQPNFQPASKAFSSSLSKDKKDKAEAEKYAPPAPSKLLSNLASVTARRKDDDEEVPVSRSVGFTETPKVIPVKEQFGAKRDERLALIEELEPGPYEHNPPSDDPLFEKVEPHSGIHLISRSLPHEDLSDYLVGRYFLSPSKLYSCIRLLPDKQGYEVPVGGDWVTIAVIAERGPIKFTRAPIALEKEDDEDNKKDYWRKKNNQPEPEKKGKRFINFKLIDFGARTSGSSATGGKAVIRGDAFLNLLLFEADRVEVMEGADGSVEKVYRGGSKGAYERFADVKEGDVVALLNPKILKPFQKSNDRPHPVDNVLAVTPESGTSIIVIGRARDLGRCNARRQDGKVCGSWCDKRVSDVCEFHVQVAVKRRRAARPEFTAGTSGMSSTSTHKRNPAFDPQRQYGLIPDEPKGGSTYVLSGHVVAGTSSDPRTMFAAENMGREGQAKAKRRLDAQADAALKKLLMRDKDGMKAVMAAREFAKKEKAEAVTKDAASKTGAGAKGKQKADDAKSAKRKRVVFDGTDDEGSGEEAFDDAMQEKSKTTSYSASIIKSLGFDPSVKPGQKRSTHDGAQKKLEALEAVRTSRTDIALGPRPGPRIRSGVFAPKDNIPKELPVSLDDSDDDLLVVAEPEPAKESKPDEVMVDLDDF